MTADKTPRRRDVVPPEPAKLEEHAIDVQTIADVAKDVAEIGTAWYVARQARKPASPPQPPEPEPKKIVLPAGVDRSDGG